MKSSPAPARIPAVAQAPSAWVGALLPVVVAVVLYAPALRFGFIWDDPLVLAQLRAMHGWRDLLVPPEIVPKFYYRPFIFLTFMLDRMFGGESPLWFHATVVGWHALATGLVFWFARLWLGSARVLEAGLAALLFAVHPMHVESVAWIAGRSDVIATVFVLATALLAARTDRRWTAWAAAMTLALALSSKEMAVAAVLLVPLRDVCADRCLHWRRYMPLILVTGGYFLLRRRALGTAGGGFATGADPAATAHDLVAAVGWYGAKFVLPIQLNAYVPDVPGGLFYPALGVAVLSVACAGMIVAWRAECREVTFLTAWCLVTLAPSLLVIVRRSASAALAERYVYLPSVAAVVLVAWGVARWRAKGGCGRMAVAAVGVVALLGAGQSTLRARVWADDLSFWADVAAKSPAYATPHRELGAAYLQRNRLEEAERELTLAVGAKSDLEGQVMSYNNLGNLQLRRDRLDAAAESFRTGLKLYPHQYLYNGLGRVAIRRAEVAQQRGDQAEVVRQVVAARDVLRQALALDPQDYKNHALLGQVLFNLGDRRAAREHFETALRIEPRGPVADTARQFLARLSS